MWPKCAFGDQKGLIRNKDMPFGNPPHHGTKKMRTFRKIDFVLFFALCGSKGGVLGQKNGGFECFGPGVR